MIDPQGSAGGEAERPAKKSPRPGSAGSTGSVGAARRSRPTQRSVQRPAERSRRADAARLVAYDALRTVDTDDAYANLVLPGLLREQRLSARDAGFATELTYGTLRMRGLYDAVLATCVDRPLTALDPGVLDALRLGVHQILGMRVPPHAAVGETVALVRHRVGQGPGGLANAVLRQVAAQQLDDWITQVAPPVESDVLGHLAIAHSHPQWIVRAFREALVFRANAEANTVGSAADLGALHDELAELLAANNAPPTVTLVARPGLATVADLLGAGSGSTPGRWSPWAAAWGGGDPRQLPEVRQQLVGVQDEGSQLVAAALAHAPITGPDRRWLDLCAGPGGKAALLGAFAAERAAELVAVEVAEHRATLVRNAVSALGDTVQVRCIDGRRVGQDQPGNFDRVLVDVPCTGLGALRRRAEARWRRTPADLGSLAPLQRDLLTSALAAVRPGGVVGYVTCSPHIAETTCVIDDVIRHRDDVRVLDAGPVLDGVVRTPIRGAGSPMIQLWPHRHGTDAMFMALLTRDDR